MVQPHNRTVCSLQLGTCTGRRRCVSARLLVGRRPTDDGGGMQQACHPCHPARRRCPGACGILTGRTSAWEHGGKLWLPGTRSTHANPNSGWPTQRMRAHRCWPDCLRRRHNGVVEGGADARRAGERGAAQAGRCARGARCWSTCRGCTRVLRRGSLWRVSLRCGPQGCASGARGAMMHHDERLPRPTAGARPCSLHASVPAAFCSSCLPAMAGRVFAYKSSMSVKQSACLMHRCRVARRRTASRGRPGSMQAVCLSLLLPTPHFFCSAIFSLAQPTAPDTICGDGGDAAGRGERQGGARQCCCSCGQPRKPPALIAV